ncbi:hypothetical protein NGM10_10375 [Halorussus salilacus]|uniref:hypothetical protein n=1 Tax=Halorussus salilacus TaxID=2953750 RepID=UPI0020A1532D|nr:hypothetical protein [Halorussus salilacus]USZ67135.1 hypothetical protein NGM10_10375 [Halorussus salilacus]
MSDDERKNARTPMPSGYTKTEWRNMQHDLLRELALRGIYRPKKVISLETVRPWFAESDREDVSQLIDDLATDHDCPLEYVTEAEQAVWLTEPDEVSEYVRKRGGMEF